MAPCCPCPMRAPATPSPQPRIRDCRDTGRGHAAFLQSPPPLTRLCLRDNPRPPRRGLGKELPPDKSTGGTGAQARAAPGFCPRGVEIQTTSPPRGRAAAGAGVMNEGRDKNQAGRGRGTHKGTGHKKPLFACACAEPALLLRWAQQGSLHPLCPVSCLWHPSRLGGSQGVPSLQGQGPSTAGPQPRAPVWPLPSTAPLLAPTPPPAAPFGGSDLHREPRGCSEASPIGEMRAAWSTCRPHGYPPRRCRAVMLQTLAAGSQKTPAPEWGTATPPALRTPRTPSPPCALGTPNTTGTGAPGPAPRGTAPVPICALHCVGRRLAGLFLS